MRIREAMKFNKDSFEARPGIGGIIVDRVGHLAHLAGQLGGLAADRAHLMEEEQVKAGQQDDLHGQVDVEEMAERPKGGLPVSVS